MYDLNNIFYYEREDIWILKTGVKENNPYMYTGKVIYVGDKTPLKDQIDKLLDLILLEDEYRNYYIEILNKIINLPIITLI